MRHGDKINNLSRTRAHRIALLRNLSCQLIEHKRIVTTLAKAKALRKYVEPIITRSKEDTTHNRRICFSRLNDKNAVKELFATVADKVAERPGGYTRIIKLAPRYGDAADMAMIELVDFNEVYKPNEEATKKTRRSRRGSKPKAQKPSETVTLEAPTTSDADEVVTESVAEIVAEETPNTEEATAITQDDLTKIEGIGPKAKEALYAAGINTFADLAAKSADDVKNILDTAEGNFNLADPTTWAQQAQLATDGKWDELTALQDELKGGKEEA